MGSTATTAAALIKEYADGMVYSADAVNTPLRNLATEIQAPSGSSYEWLTNYSDNASSTSYVEGEAASATGNGSYAKAALAYSGGYARTMLEITGHARDYAKDGWIDLASNEINRSMLKHYKYHEALQIAALEAAIDSSGSVYGLTRSTVNFASYEASIVSPAASDLATMWNTLAASPIEAPMENMVLLSTIGVKQTYANLFTAASNRPLNYMAGGNVEGSTIAGGVTFNGRPWKEIPGMTSSVLLMIDPSLLFRVVRRDLKVEPYAKTGDSDIFAITSSEIIVYKNPRYAGKLTDI